MHSWPLPTVPDLHERAYAAHLGHSVALELFDTADQKVREVIPGQLQGGAPASQASMYVCGITPYDATHLGHAATYLTFDLIYRQLLDNGYRVHYVQNITDVDDPLFERADRDGVDWQELGTDQINLFRSDMEILSVIPPRDYIGAIESIPEVVEMVSDLIASGAAYQLDDEFPDIYFRHGTTAQFGYESNYSSADMEHFFAERGGDPDRPGKEHPLDALLWRAARPGEPSWNAPFGPGRPGWHIECSAIALNRLGGGFDIQGGGSDLAFPHHEFSAAHAEAATGCARMANHYVHAGMISLQGVKMSKSLGNLVFVSKLVAAGEDPAAIRLGVFSSHYRSDRDWSEEVLSAARTRLALWRQAAAAPSNTELAAATVAEVRAALAADLDTPAALSAVDRWAEQTLSGGATPGRGGELLAAAVDALMGVKL